MDDCVKSDLEVTHEMDQRWTETFYTLIINAMASRLHQSLPLSRRAMRRSSIKVSL